MKEITRIEKVYDFNELSDSAKETARWEYCEAFRNTDDFTESCKELISKYFPKSEYEIQYSLSYCQGDGVNIYGKFEVSEAVDFILKKCEEEEKHTFDKQVLRFFNWLKTLGYTIEIPQNYHYTYCIVDQKCNFMFDILYLLDEDGYTSGGDTHAELLSEFDAYFKKYIEAMCKEFETNGYKYFYEVEDEEIIETWLANEYEGFYENGKPCYS